MHKRNKSQPLKNLERGFSLVEILVSLVVATLIMVVLSNVLQNGYSINGKTEKRANASSLAFQKVQDYVNLSFTNIPIGDVANNYEVEDFSAEASAINIAGVSAKLFVKPESLLNTTATTTTTNFTQTAAANAAFINGSEINSNNVNDATGVWSNTTSRIRDNDYTNYTYNVNNSNPNNLSSPSIDLGSQKVVDTMRVTWYTCRYGASNFRIEAKNNSPNNNNGWTTVKSGLSDSMPYSCGNTGIKQDIPLTPNVTPYRYWRLYIVNADDSRYDVITELEAFGPGSPGDIVEQQGTDATDSPGSLFFSDSNLEMAKDGSRGNQSLGIIFNTIRAPQAATIDSAYIQFTANEADSGNATLQVSAAKRDSAVPWAGNFAVDKAVDTNSSDGSVGTSAKTTWTPAAWSASESGLDTRVNVTAIVQELVNRTGWVSNNDMAFAVKHISGSGRRVAARNPAPRLIINWSKSDTSSSTGGYVDANGDGDVDNPTLVRVTAEIEYEAYKAQQKIVYTTFVRKFGIGN